MAKAHKKAGRAIEVVSSLPADRLVVLCQEAAEQSKIHLDDAQPERLVFSVRGMFRPNKNHLMDFEVRLTVDADERIATSRILRYTTTQATVLFFIPFGPKTMPALPVYEKFMQRFRELVEHFDAAADVEVTG